MITLTSLLFLSLCLCSPLSCVLDEVNTLVSWLLKSIGFWISLGRLLTNPAVRPVMGPRGVLPLPSFPSNTAKGDTKALITNSSKDATTVSAHPATLSSPTVLQYWAEAKTTQYLDEPCSCERL